MKTKACLLVTLLGIVGMMSVATAQTTNIILGTDFDGFGDYNYGYAFAYAGSELGTTAVPPSTFAVVPTGGVNNTAAAQATVDYTELATDPNYQNATSYTYAGVALYLVFIPTLANITPVTTLNTLTLSCDVKVQGLLPGITNTDVILNSLQFGTNGAPITNAVASFTGDVGFAGSNYVHFDIPLSSLALNGGDAGIFTNSAILNAINCIEIEFRLEGQTGSINSTNTSLSTIEPVFGFTTNGELNVDNVYLTESSAAVPTQEKVIWQANFDNTYPSFVYGFHDRDGTDNATGTLTTNLTGGVGGSAALQYTADLSSWSSTPPTSFSGIGVGGGAVPIPYQLTSTNKASYRVYIAAKAGGFIGANTNVGAVMDLQFLAPDGTLSASNGQPDVVLDLAPTLSLTTNWQSFVFDGSGMPIGIYNGGSQALFDQYLAQVNQIQVQVQANGSPNLGTVFGYDADNTVDIDNIKVVELVPATPPLTAIKTNNQVEVFWTDPSTGGTAELQSSTNVAGPYLDVPGASSSAASPYTVPPTATKTSFFRTQWVAPTGPIFSQLQVLWPGQTNAPGTPGGYTGSATPVSLGNNPVVVVTINACDSTWHIVPVSGDSIYLTNSAASDPLGVLPNAASLVNGTVQQAMAFQTQGSWTINAVDSSNTNIPPATSSSISVGP